MYYLAVQTAFSRQAIVPIVFGAEEMPITGNVSMSETTKRARSLRMPPPSLRQPSARFRLHCYA